jgi:hypothetical protein
VQEKQGINLLVAEKFLTAAAQVKQCIHYSLQNSFLQQQRR